MKKNNFSEYKKYSWIERKINTFISHCKVWFECMHSDIYQMISIDSRIEHLREKYLICDHCGGLKSMGVCDTCGFGTVCCVCLKVKQRNGEFIKTEMPTLISHSICKECINKVYPGIK